MNGNSKMFFVDITNKKILSKIKCKYLIHNIFSLLNLKKSLEIIKYNKFLQNKVDINISTYKNYFETFSPIEIDVTISKDCSGNFISYEFESTEFIHVYLNNDKIIMVII